MATAIEIGAMLTLDDVMFRSTLEALPAEAEGVFKRIQSYAETYLSFRGVTAFVEKATGAWMVQQDAVEGVNAALRSVGANAAMISPRLQKLASEIQRTTRYGDEGTLAAMAGALRLGLDPSRMEEYTRAAVGLAAKLGTDLTTAFTYLVRAQAGHTEMLGRMGITLDKTKSKQEQFNDLLKMSASSFEIAEDAAKTLSGQIQQMSNNVGDAWENIGKRLEPAVSSAVGVVSKLALGFNNLSSRGQDAVLRLGRVAAIFALMNTTLGKGLNNALSSAIAGIGRMTLSWQGAATAVKGFAAALGPVGWAMLALTAFQQIADHINGGVRDATEELEKANGDLADATSKLSSGDENRANSLAQIARLEELSKYQRLNNSETQEAQRLIDALNASYGKRVAAIDAVNGKLNIEREAVDGVVRAMREQRKAELELQLLMQERAMEAARKRRDAIENEKSPLLPALWDAVTSDLQYDPVNDQYNTKMERELLERYSAADKELEAARKAVGAARRQLDAFNRTQGTDGLAGEKGAANAELQAASKAQRTALDALQKAREERRYAAADELGKAEILERRLVGLRDEFQRINGTMLEGNVDLGRLNEDELKKLKEIEDTEEKIRLAREKSANALKEEVRRRDGFQRDIQRQLEDMDWEKRFNMLGDIGNLAGQRRMLEERSSASDEQAQSAFNTYNAMLERAQERQGQLTKQEQEDLEKAREKWQNSVKDSMADSRRLDEFDRRRMGNGGGGSFGAMNVSSGLFRLMMPRMVDTPAEETARNTADMRDTLHIIRDAVRNNQTAMQFA